MTNEQQTILAQDTMATCTARWERLQVARERASHRRGWLFCCAQDHETNVPWLTSRGDLTGAARSARAAAAFRRLVAEQVVRFERIVAMQERCIVRIQTIPLPIG